MGRLVPAKAAETCVKCRLSELEPHDVAARAGGADLPKAEFFEGRHEAHEAVARRNGVDRVGLEHRGVAFFGVSLGGFDQLAAVALTAYLPAHIYVGERPDVFAGFGRGAAEVAVGVARRDRHPGDRLAVE